MTRIPEIVLAVALAAGLVSYGTPPAEAASKKAGKKGPASNTASGSPMEKHH